MTLIVEDGTGVSGANSYASLAYIDDYHSIRGNVAWAGTDSEKEIAVIKAMDFIEGKNYRGLRQYPSTQSLTFPRLYLGCKDGVEITGVPEDVKKALCEYALRALTTDLSPDPENKGGFAVKRTLVGSTSKGAVETEWDTNIDLGTSKEFPKADLYLKWYLKPTANTYYR